MSINSLSHNEDSCNCLAAGMNPQPASETAHALAPAEDEVTACVVYPEPECYTSPERHGSLAIAWAELFEPFNWDWFVTLTFEDATHPESAAKVFNNLIHAINRDVYGRHYWKDKGKSVFWVRGTEWQKRGVIHYHSLIGGIPDFVRMSKYQYWWQDRVAKQCSFERYDASRGGRYYLAKSAYTFKRGEIDLNEALILEAKGLRICAKELHDEFCRLYVSQGRLRPSLDSYH